jgi:hypothetical protein
MGDTFGQAAENRRLGCPQTLANKGALKRTIFRALTTGKYTLLTVVAMLTLALTSTALAGNGVGSVFNLGVTNTVNALTKLTGSVAGSSLVIDNNSTGTGATALNLQVKAGRAPMKVNSGTKVTNLNADKIDGKDSTAFVGPTNFDAKVLTTRDVFSQDYGPLPLEYTYTSHGGTLIISASGTGFRSSSNARGPGLIRMNISVDGLGEAVAQTYANERDSHKAFVDGYAVVKGLPAGDHTISLEAAYNEFFCNTASENNGHICTTTNGTDSYAVSTVEIPD